MRFYRLLLRLYPASFRSEYGEEMCAVFEERRRSARGPVGRLLVWLDTLLELQVSAAQVHADILRQDARYTARTLARSPGFALTAIIVMALGIGATTAAFSITDHVLLRPLPYKEPQSLVRMWESPPNYRQMELSPPNYRDWKTMSTSFEAMGAYTTLSANLAGQGEPRHVELTLVTSEVFEILGVQPFAGRFVNAEDDRDGAAGTVVLSYGLWQEQFGGDLAALGRQVSLDGHVHVVIGVMPPGFHFPDRGSLLWRPLQLGSFGVADEDRNNNYLDVIARLRPGVSIEQARAEMSAIAAQLERAYPEENKETGATVLPTQEVVSSQSRLLLTALLGASLCLLLIACTNVANLFLARALARRRELAVRTALGAGRERLTRQLLTESLCLALLGGALGALVAVAALPLLTRLVPSNLPISQMPTLDLRVLAFAAGLTVLTGIVFGLAPAIKVGWDAASGLREGARAGGGRKERLRAALVVAEVSASVVLLISAGLLLRALWRVQDVDPGFRAENVLTLRTALPIPKYAEVARRKQFYSSVISEVAALPGVTHAAYISYLPMTMRGGIWPVSFDGKPADRAGTSTASLRYVTPGFFAAMGVPLKQGRDVSEADAQKSPYVAVVSESFAQRFWSGQDPIGRSFNFVFADRTVVGVVGDVRVRGLERSSEPQVYLPYQQVNDGWIIGYVPKDLVIRAAAPETLIPAVRRIVRSVDREQPVSDVRMLTDVLEAETAPRTVQLRVLGAFAAVAFFLAGIGIHGLLAYTVSNRTREIGVRMALGAQRSNILTLILREGALLAAAGLVVGAGLAYAAGRAMQGLLFGVPPADTVTFLAAAGLSVLMSFAGSLLPAFRATRVDPTIAIRAE